MKKLFYFIIFFLYPLMVFGQNVGIGTDSPSTKLEVEGGITTDSIDVSSGLIKNVADPISSQDAATKAYVDLLESSVDSLKTKIELLISFLDLTVQQRLDLGVTPIEIYNSDNSLLDSLYGKTYQGGLIAYLNTSTGTGLIGAPVNQSAGMDWGCFNTFIGGTSAAIVTGQVNTTFIVNGCGESDIAARLCDELVYNGYEDWFLPSKDELNELYTNLKANGFGDFSNDFYWSSTEEDNYFAWFQSFGAGFQNYDDKQNHYDVRAVRAF